MTRVEGNAGPPANDRDLGRALKLAWSLPSADFYATADLATAKRIGGVGGVFGRVGAGRLLALGPPPAHRRGVGGGLRGVLLGGTPVPGYRPRPVADAGVAD